MIFSIFLGLLSVGFADIITNDIKPDGSYDFEHRNDDYGRYYHSAKGYPNQIVRGRYGSRDPATGKVEEVKYTSGPRGFRANGANIHRKMDLTQYFGGPKGSLDDLNADPLDVPTYSFKYQNYDQERIEDANEVGDVSGLYSYVDDTDERHTVRYTAGADKGFVVVNGVPDNNAADAYRLPLLKAPNWTRGKIMVTKAANGEYDFIATGADHRRQEKLGPDGLVHGSYSFLDDNSVQHTVEYVAGAGIGFKVLSNTVGHKILNPTGSSGAPMVSSVTSALNSGGYQSGGLPSSSGGLPSSSGGFPSGPGGISSNSGGFPSSTISPTYLPTSSFSPIPSIPGYSDISTLKPPYTGGNSYAFNRQDTSSGGFPTTTIRPQTSGGGALDQGRRNSYSGNHLYAFGAGNEAQNSDFGGNRNRGSDRRKPTSSSNRNSDRKSYSDFISRNGINSEEVTSKNINSFQGTSSRGGSSNSERRYNTIIKNVGERHFGIPPGQAVRAHIQNIDLTSFGARIPSPSETFEKDLQLRRRIK
ncbi:hypothetical protein ACFFRR_009527 [Megaselia abdita]